MKIDYNEVLRRMGEFRTQAGISRSDMSLRLGYSEPFIKRIEQGEVELKVSTLLEFCEILGITPQEFFYLGDKFSPANREILDLFDNLSPKNQEIIIELLKSLR